MDHISCWRTCWGILHYHSLDSDFDLCHSKMSNHLNIVTAQITGYFVMSVLYSFYLYTFFQCLYALLRSRSRWKGYSNIKWGLVLVTLTLFINGTFNISLGLLHLIQQFSFYMGPVVWVNTAKVVQFSIFESALNTYRTWLILLVQHN